MALGTSAARPEMSSPGCGWNSGCVPVGEQEGVRLERQGGAGHEVSHRPCSEDDGRDGEQRALSGPGMCGLGLWESAPWWLGGKGPAGEGGGMQVDQMGGKGSVESE